MNEASKNEVAASRNERIRGLKSACNEPKSQLIKIWRELVDLHGTKARGLESAIRMLEEWQNRP